MAPRTLAQRMGHAMGTVKAAHTRLDRLVAECGHKQHWQANAALLAAVQEAVTLLSATADRLERLIIEQRMADGTLRDEVPVQGVGLVSIHRTADRKGWDHEGLAGQVLDAHLTERGGEVPDPWDVVHWLLEAAAPGYWRVGVLKGLRIPVDEFCTTIPGRRKVKIT